MVHLRDRKAQALVESIFIMPILFMVIIAIVWFSRILITRQQLLMAARYGTDLVAYTTLNEKEIRQEIRNYLTHRMIKGRKLDPGKLPDNSIVIKIDSFELPEYTAADYFVPLLFEYKMKEVAEKLLRPDLHTSYVELYYDFEVPRLFSTLGRETITVTARSEVLAGTGCRSAIHRRKTKG